MAESTPADISKSFIRRMLASMQMDEKNVALAPMVRGNFSAVNEQVSQEDRFLSGLAAILYNIDAGEGGRFDKGKVLESIRRIDSMVNEQLNEVMHHKTFQHIESTWRGIDDLVEHTNFKANISIELLDVGKDELYDDFESNTSDLFGSSLFAKTYIAEYDQYGGQPYGAILGMYEFANLPRDLFWLRSMSKIAAASHAPFVGAVSPQFFGCEDIEEVEALRDLDGLLSQPRYGKWNQLRDTDEAAYLGLCFPRYVLRLPYTPENNPSGLATFVEEASGARDKYLWGSSVILFARNLLRSFETTGWCQYIRGPKGGGLINGLPVDTFNIRGQDETRPPVEIAIPDYRELEYSRNGFIPLIYRKSSTEATFFGAQSIKRPKRFKDVKDTENSQLVCNLSYTFSITRIAHYIKSIMRDNIGSSANAGYIEETLTKWINQYVTSNVNPDDLTLRVYPFRAASVKVQVRAGQIGWYDCQVSILPHLQFEGMDVELRLESRLG